MRDLALVIVIGAACVWSLRQPWIGMIASVWISLMSPHVQYGYAVAEWPVAAAVVGFTAVGFVVGKDRWNPIIGAPVWWFIAFWVWICVTLPFSIHYDLSEPLWTRSMKIFVIVLLALALINTRAKLDALVWVIVGSLGFYGIKGGIFTVLTGGNFRVWGPGGFVEGNNELAAALVATIPLMRYLYLQMTRSWRRHAMLGAMILTAITVLGSHSRGAFIAIAAMAVFLWLKTERQKLLGAVLMIAIGTAALSLMPAEWWQRMESIEAYQDDSSAMGRINAWWNAWNLAKDRFFGGGFMIYTPTVFQRYAPDPDDLHAAHSIYFQVLGEHGFVGLALFLAIGASTWWVCRKLIRLGRRSPEVKWAADLGALMQVSILGFGVGGAFLSLAYFDLPYYQMAITVIGWRIASAQPAAQRTSLPAPAMAAVALR